VVAQACQGRFREVTGSAGKEPDLIGELAHATSLNWWRKLPIPAGKNYVDRHRTVLLRQIHSCNDASEQGSTVRGSTREQSDKKKNGTNLRSKL